MLTGLGEGVIQESSLSLGEGVIQESRILGGRGALGRFRDLGARDWRIQHFKQMLINHLILQAGPDKARSSSPLLIYPQEGFSSKNV